ncbi:MAG TPA: ABC transporter permease [Chloroflexota bacterium]|jgi:NitT/TauT family transport system permease protein
MAQSQAAAVARPVATKEKRRRTWDDYEGTVYGVGAVILFLLFWEGVGTKWTYFGYQLPFASALPQVNPMFTSAPSRILGAADKLFFNPNSAALVAALAAGNLGGAWEVIAKGSIYKDIWVSFQEFALGYLLSVIVGIPLGMLTGWYRRLNYALEPFVSALYATPRVALLPLFIIWFGIGINSKIAVVFSGALFPVLISTFSGMRALDPNIVKCARSFGANDWQIFRTIAIPGSIPFMITGLRLGVGRALIGVVVGELYAATAGVGYLITVAGATFQTDKVFVGVMIICFSGLGMMELLRHVEHHFEPWRQRVGAN